MLHVIGGNSYRGRKAFLVAGFVYPTTRGLHAKRSTMLILLWIACGLVGAMIGGKKGEAGFGFLLGIFLGPIGLLLIFFSKGNQKTCPFCKGTIHPEAVRCNHCQKDLPPQIKTEETQQSKHSSFKFTRPSKL